ncbi:hypothetical protein CLM62_11820 [Streptomyces sp. SA15]|nr:hypothetical protein CLM62_11820 [Streptomyces sp. SA15]
MSADDLDPQIMASGMSVVRQSDRGSLQRAVSLSSPCPSRNFWAGNSFIAARQPRLLIIQLHFAIAAGQRHALELYRSD